MRRIAPAIACLASLWAAPAVAQPPQFPQTLPANTVVGRLGIGPGPAQAIPFSSIGPNLITNYLAVTSPLSITGLNLKITGIAGSVLSSVGTTPAFTATPMLGVASTTTGTLTLANSGNSGTVTIQAPSTATTWTFKFPTTAGSNGQGLVTDGSGNTSWSAAAGTVNSGTAGQLSYYAATAAAVSGNANLNVSSGALTIGQAGSVLGTVALAGSTSGTTTLTPAVAASGTLTLPAATDTLVGRATTDTLTNKTLTSPILTTPTLGVATATSINKMAITAPATSSTLAVADGKTLTASASLTLAGTDATTITFQGTDTYVGRATTDTLTNKTLTSPTINGATIATSTFNGNTFTAGTGTLTIAASKTLTVSNTITFADGADGTTQTFQGTDTIVGRTTTDTLTNKTLTAPVINGGTVAALTGFGVRSSGSGAFDLTIINTENLTAARALTITVENAARTIDLSGNLTLSASFTTAGGNPLTLTTTGSTNVTLPTSGTLATIGGSQTFSGANVFSATTQLANLSMSSGKIFPTSDGTTALQITKADGTTRVVDVDTTNARVGINKTPGSYDLDVNGATNVGGVLTFGTLSATSLGASPSTITGLVLNNSPNSSNDYLAYYNAASGTIEKATLASVISAATAGVSSLNGLTGGISIAQGSGITVSAGVSSVTVAIATGQIPGTGTNDAASAGNVGEYSSSNIASGSAVSLVNSTAKNLTSISLTAGDWDVSCAGQFQGGGTTLVFSNKISISTTTNTDGTDLDGLTQIIGNQYTQYGTNTPGTVLVAGYRMSLGSTTTVYCVANSAFTTSTTTVYGKMWARRMR